MAQGKPSLLFITINDIKDATFGGGVVSRRNFDALRKVCDVTLYRISKKSTAHSALSLLTGYFPPSSGADARAAADILTENRIGLVFFDSSVLGAVAHSIRKKFPSVKTVTFFHNEEVDYLDVRFGNRWRKYPYRLSARHSETMITRLSDRMVALNPRDAERVRMLYGRAPELCVPVTFPDRYIPEPQAESGGERVCLLVGAMRRDTYEGVAWFCREVAPHLRARTQIVGRGYESVRAELAAENVEVVGAVDDLGAYYNRADAVALPILSGAGMKVKTAEALMYGKTVFGTKEAFEGYDVAFPAMGAECETKEQYIEGINGYLASHGRPERFNAACRNLFLEKYEASAADARFAALIEELCAESGCARS